MGIPPEIGDFADLSLGDEELAALKACRPGTCDLRLGDKAIARFETEVDWTAPGAEVFIADKQIYASRYTDAAVTVISLASSADGTGYYALVGARARSTMLGGMAARMLRGRLEKETVSTSAMYLNWIQQSLSMSR